MALVPIEQRPYLWQSEPAGVSRDLYYMVPQNIWYIPGDPSTYGLDAALSMRSLMVRKWGRDDAIIVAATMSYEI